MKKDTEIGEGTEAGSEAMQHSLSPQKAALPMAPEMMKRVGSGMF